MFEGSNRRTGLVVGLLLVAVIQPVASAQETAAIAPDEPQYRTWTNRQGVTIEAKFVGLDEGKVLLKKKEDGKIYPTLAIESLSDADQQYVRSLGKKPSEERPPDASPPATPKKPTTPRSGPSYTFYNKKLRQTLTGVILERISTRTGAKVRVKTDEGKVGWILVPPWEISKKPAPGGEEPVPGDVAEPKAPSGSGGPPVGSSKSKEVVVTGVGPDPEKALQNAFSEAIEQTVGVLVDAESAVKNDQLIRDEVLTYSRGYVEKFEVVKRWEEGGLQHATILAVVARGKLVEKLRGIKIAVDEISGGLAARQFRFDAENERRAAEMFQKALDDFDLTKLTKVDVVAKEITRDGTNANVRIRARVSPDMTRWEDFSHGLRAVLAAISIAHAGVSAKPSREGKVFIVSVRGTPLKHQLSGPGILVGLLANVSGQRAQWELFRVPDIMDGPVREAAKKSYHLVYTLLDDQGATVVRTNQPITGRERTNHRLGPIHYGNYQTDMPDVGHDNAWWIGPVLMGWTFLDVCDVAHYETQNTVSISQEDLSKVVKTVVLLEEDTGHGNLGHAKHSSATHEPRGSRSGSGTNENSHKRGQ
jgi:hypothetical protein